MRLVVLGAGRMGEGLLDQLSRLPEAHDIMLIERERSTSQQLARKYDIGTTEADARIPAVLTRHCSGADVLFALTNRDATNLLAALTATHPSIGVRRAAVRISDARHRQNPLLRDGSRGQRIETILPEALIAQEISGRIRYPGVRSVRSFGDGALVMLRAVPRERRAFGRRIQDLDILPRGWILTGVRRGSREPLEIPHGGTRIHEGDEVFAVGPTPEASNFLRSIGCLFRPAQRVVIAGLGQVGYRLGELLLDRNVDLTVIRRRSGGNASLPTHTIVGDATEEDILEEAGVEGADFFVAATNADEVNFMSAHLAKKAGARRTIALHNRDDLREVMRSLGVDHPISPGVITAGALMKLLHSRAMIRLDWIEGGGELVEMEVEDGSEAARKPLSRVGVPEGCILGEVVRERMGPFVPDGNTELVPGDRVALFLSETRRNAASAEDRLNALEALFGAARK